MNDRVAASFQRSVVMAIAALSLLLAAILLFVVDDGLMRLVLATVALFVLRRIWSLTRRKRELSSRGFFAGRRVGNHWVYEELHDGEVQALELPLAYVGRGEHEILIPGEQTWPERVPGWASGRRAEIVERLATVFKRSDMRTDD